MRNPQTDLDIQFGERETIGLEELQSVASFLTRKDRKYIVPRSALDSILVEIDKNARVLEIDGKQSFHYKSSYFDTDDYQSYLGALRQRPNRFKVRVRAYRDSGLSFLEAKTRDHRGYTVKQRFDRDGSAAPMLYDSERMWLETFREIGPIAQSLEHRISTTYIRSTLVLPNGEGRLTIDHDLAFSSAVGRVLSMPEVVIIETKGTGHPTSADRVLWRYGVRPLNISKFGCGMCLLDSSLPSNRWHRVQGQLVVAAMG